MIPYTLIIASVKERAVRFKIPIMRDFSDHQYSLIFFKYSDIFTQYVDR